MDNIHVAIRMRPFIQRERDTEAQGFWKADGTTVQQQHNGKEIGKPYRFDRVYDGSASTATVYDDIAHPLVESAMNGFDGTIFAYGQTASGKTHTMMGTRLSPGIIPSAVAEIFEAIENTPDREFLLRVSYMELYNETLTDLLTDEKKPLSIRENGERVYVGNLTEEVCTSSAQMLSFMRKGDARRHVGRTNMNEFSSRSHTVFSLIIESRDRRQQADGAVKVAHLNLVDLAGSERSNETKAEGARLKEACNINKSLFVLGTVINRLASGAEFIPFRDSQLTRILSSSLGGNAKAAIICTITAASLEQTLSTLQFATRAKTIKNKPVMNEILSDEALMQRMKKEIENLKKRLEESKEPVPSLLTDEQMEALLTQEREKAKMEVMKEMKQKMDNFKTMVVVSKSGGTPNRTSKRKMRRETWCPGMKLAPLLPPPQPLLLRPALNSTSSPLSEGASTNSSSVLGGDSLLGASDASISSTTLNLPSDDSPSSISSSEFNDENAGHFRDQVLANDSKEMDLEIPDVDVSFSRKTKRRRGNVRFDEESIVHFIAEEFSKEAGCQTEAFTVSTSPESDDGLQEVYAALAAATADAAAKSEEASRLRAEVAEFAALLEFTKLEGSTIREQEDVLQAQLTEALNEKRDLEYQLDTEKERYRSMNVELRHQLQESLDSNREMSENLASQEKTELEAETEKVKAAEERLEQQAKLICELESEIHHKRAPDMEAELSQLKGELERKSDELTQLMEKLTDANMEREQQAKVICDLESEIHHKRVPDMKAELSHMKEELERKSEELTHMMGKLTDANMERESLQMQLTEHVEEVELMRVESIKEKSQNQARQEKVCAEMEAELEAETEKVKAAEERLDQQAKLICDLESEIQHKRAPDMEAELSHMKEELERKSDELTHMMEKLTDANMEREQQAKLISDLESKNHHKMAPDMEAELSHMKRELERKSEELMHMTETLTDANMQMEQQAKLICDLESEIHHKMAPDMEAELSHMKGELERKSDELTHMMEKLTDANMEKESLQMQLTKRVEEVELMRVESIKEISENKARQEKICAEMETKLEAETQKVNAAEERLDQQAKLICELESEIRHMRAPDMEMELSHTKGELKRKSEELMHMTEKLTDANMQMESLQKQLTKRVEEVELMRVESIKEISENQARQEKVCAEMEAKLEAETQKVNAAEERLEQQAKLICELESEIHHKRAPDMEVELSHMKGELERKSVELTQMMEKLTDANMERESLQMQLTKRVEEVELMRVESIKEISENRARQEKICAEMEAKLEAETEKVKAAEERLEQQAKLICELESEIHHKRAPDMEAELSHMKGEFERKSDELTHMMEKLTDANMERESLQKQLTKYVEEVELMRVESIKEISENQARQDKVCAEMEAELEAETQKVKAAEERLDQQAKLICDLESEIHHKRAPDMEAELSHMKGDLERKSEELMQMMEKLTSANMERDSLQKQLTKYVEEVELMRVESIKEKSQNQARQDKVCAEMEAELEAETEKVKVAEERLEQQAKLICELESEIHQKRAPDIEAELSHMKGELERKSDELTQMLEILTDANIERDSLQKQLTKYVEEVELMKVESIKEKSQNQARQDKVCAVMEAELEAETEKVKAAEERLEQQAKLICDLESEIHHKRVPDMEAELGQMKEELERKSEELMQMTEKLTDANMERESLQKKLTKRVEEVKRVRLNCIKETSQNQVRMDKVCAEMEAELEAETQKVKAAEERLEQQAKLICELESGNHHKRAPDVEAELSHMKRELKRKSEELTQAMEKLTDANMQMEQQAKHICELESGIHHTRAPDMNIEHDLQVAKLEERIRDLESSAKHLEERNRVYRNELRREHERGADASVLSCANYPEAGVCGSGSVYDVALYSLRAENQAMTTELKQKQKKYETTKTQRDEQVTRNARLKEEVLYWKDRYDKVKGRGETVRPDPSRPLTDVNSQNQENPADESLCAAAPTGIKREDVPDHYKWILDAFK